MAIDKRLQIKDEQGNLVDYDILASDVKFLPDGKDLPTKLAEMQDAIEDAGSGDGTVTGVKVNGTTHDPNEQGVVDIGTVITSISVNGGTPAAPVNGNVNISMEVGDIPEKVSELENDEGYITAEEVGDIVATTGDIAIVETSDYVDIMIYSPEMSVKLGGNDVSSLAFFSDPTQQESLSLAVSGSHLKANIVATLEGTDENKFSISGSPITQSGGAASGTLTVAYTGTTAAGQSASATLKLTSGDLVKTISLHYAYASGPFISVNPASLSFKAATGSTETKTVAISASQLTGDVVVSVPSGSAFQVCATENGTYGNSVTVAKADAEQGETIYVKYTAGSSAASASLSVTSTGATSRSVDLTGAVSSLTVSKQTMTFSTDQGVAVTDTFTVEGANLNEDIRIEASGTGFSVSPQTIAHSDGTVASTTVTVTYQPSAAGTHTGSITIQSSGVTKTISLSGTVVETPNFTAANNYRLQVNGIYYDVMMSNNAPTTDLRVNNSSYSANPEANSYSGDIVIPATISGKLDGVATTFTVKDIRTHALSYCSNLNSVVVPDTVTAIHDRAFSDSSLTRIVIGNGLEGFTIGGTNYSYVFNESSVIDVADFGTSFKDFGGDANHNTFRLSNNGEVYLRWTGSRQSGGNTYYHARAEGMPFRNANGETPCAAKLYVPSDKVSYYKNSSNWAAMFDVNNILAIDE